MHELGLVVYVIDAVEQLAKEKNLTEIGSITLELGEVSSVVPDYFKDCWNYSHKKSDLLKNTELKIEIIPALTVCSDCGKTYPTVEFKKKCPHCSSDDTYLLRGNEFNIKEIEAC
ncbi:MAG: hydrogenase maturation nickel metallochaperone HypA [Clostridiales bacterium]|jgi:hydrogenase nickel incorporation protein HypA/HybF|nr:hydrogenase maturation nickel metallochaperone HypA [Clostridiales bacterium]